MSKTDKFLYAGIAGIAVAGLVALLMSVFSPPKQTAEKAEETVETPTIEQQTLEPATTGDEPMPTEVPYYYIDENGNKVFLTQEEFDAGLEYEQELKRKEAERLAKEKAEQEWWESRKDWVERFPFEPTYQPEITFDPNVYAPKKREMTPTGKCEKWREITASCECSTKAACLTPKSSNRCTTSSKKSPAKRRTIPSFSVGHSIHSKATIKQKHKTPKQSIEKTPKY